MCSTNNQKGNRQRYKWVAKRSFRRLDQGWCWERLFRTRAATNKQHSVSLSTSAFLRSCVLEGFYQRLAFLSLCAVLLSGGITRTTELLMMAATLNGVHGVTAARSAAKAFKHAIACANNQNRANTARIAIASVLTRIRSLAFWKSALWTENSASGAPTRSATKLVEEEKDPGLGNATTHRLCSAANLAKEKPNRKSHVILTIARYTAVTRHGVSTDRVP